MKVLLIGFHHYVNLDRIVSILDLRSTSPGSTMPRASVPIRRILDNAEGHDLLIVATAGRSRKSVIVMDTGHIVLSSLSAETLIGRLERKDAPISG